MQKEVCNSGDEDCKSLEVKIRKLKLEFEKLAFEKRCEVSTLLRETGLAESGFADKLMRKDEEIKQLQSSNHEKDRIISRLMAEREDNGSKKKAGKIARLSDEVKSLRRSRRLNTDV